MKVKEVLKHSVKEQQISDLLKIVRQADQFPSEQREAFLNMAFGNHINMFEEMRNEYRKRGMEV